VLLIGGKDLGKDWRDWIIAHPLRKEAVGLINGETPVDAGSASIKAGRE
jgi:hypothetical protein